MRIDRFKLKLPEIIDAILAEIPHKEVRALVAALAMAPNDIVPKRKERPRGLVAYSVDLIGRALGLRDDKLTELAKMTIAFVEAADVLDDAVDGDYKEGHQHQLLAVSSALFFVANRSALRLGASVAEQWLTALHDLPYSILLEKDGDGSSSTYLRAVNAQAAQFGSLGRAAATAAEAPPASGDKVADLCKALYILLQYIQDQHEAPRELADDSSAKANIMHHMGPDGLRLFFSQLHGQVIAALDVFAPSRDTDHLRQLVESIRPA